MDGEATTLHPCWEAYRLADKYVGMSCVTFGLLMGLIFTGCL